MHLQRVGDLPITDGAGVVRIREVTGLRRRARDRRGLVVISSAAYQGSDGEIAITDGVRRSAAASE